MFILSNFLIAISQVLNIAINILLFLIIVRALISWVNPDPYNFIVQFLYKTTEPFLCPIRRIMPSYNIGIDLSPLLAFFALLFLRLFLVNTLLQLGMRLR